MSDTDIVVEENVTEESGELQLALIFELENLAIGGRKITYDVYKTVLGEQNFKLTPVQFSRYCLHPNPVTSITNLMESGEKGKKISEKLINEIKDDAKLSLVDASNKMDKALKAILAVAKARNMKIGLLSYQDSASAEKLAAKLGLNKLNPEIFASDWSERDFPAADGCLRLAKNMEVDPSLCIVVATSAYASRAALSAGMRCVAIPDQFTSFQDYSGADLVVDALDVSAFETVVGLAVASAAKAS